LLNAREFAFYGIVFGTLLLNSANIYAALNAAPARGLAAKRFLEMALGALFLVTVSALIYSAGIW
jgi:hypothetical protein